MVMFGNGARIGMAATAVVIRLPLLDRPAEATALFAAAVGAAVLPSAARRIASGAYPATAATLSVFGLSWLLLPWTDFLPFTIYNLPFFHLLLPERSED